MAYTRNQPVATDDLDVSQPFLVSNTNGADDSFGVNHYKFSDLTANNGKHNNVQTPKIVGAAHPVTPAGECAFYAMQDSANLGLLQYSRGPSNAVPSPVTYFQSPATGQSINAGATIDIFDFTGLTRASCMFYAFGSNSNPTPVNAGIGSFVVWNGSVLYLGFTHTPAFLQTIITSPKLQLKNNTTDAFTNSVFWTLLFLRTS